MVDKERVLLATWVDTSLFRWWTAALRTSGDVVPLLRSGTGDLSLYVSRGADDQASFLRHRLCSILQRGCDRLWAKSLKAEEFVFALNDQFQQAAPDLTQRTADHLHQWMSNPPVTFVVARSSDDQLKRQFEPLAGKLAGPWQKTFDQSIDRLIALTQDDSLWEEVPRPKI